MKGQVLERSTGQPVANVYVYVEKKHLQNAASDFLKSYFKMIPKAVKTTELGEYWRLLAPGVYRIYALGGKDGKRKSNRETISVEFKRYSEAQIVNLFF